MNTYKGGEGGFHGKSYDIFAVKLTCHCNVDTINISITSHFFVGMN